MDTSWCKNGYVWNFKLYTDKSIHTFLSIVQLMLLGKEKDGSAKKGLAHQVLIKPVSSLSNNSYSVHW